MTVPTSFSTPNAKTNSEGGDSAETRGKAFAVNL